MRNYLYRKYDCYGNKAGPGTRCMSVDMLVAGHWNSDEKLCFAGFFRCMERVDNAVYFFDACKFIYSDYGLRLSFSLITCLPFR